MKFIKNLLALIGLLAIVGGIYGWTKFGEDYKVFKSFDAKAPEVYWEMWQKLKKSKVTAEATVWMVPFAEGITVDEAEESMAIAANSWNIKNVGVLPLSEDVFAKTGEPQKFLKIFEYCDSLTAREMVDYNVYIAAYLPCRVAMVEDDNGNFALYSMNMDMILHGGETLPPELFKKASRIKSAILDIMQKGANGDF
ncbi:MAG TPA: DUF302 domain-containing protein, partial [Gammaproteobacteria bacterium]|nr:DUF302 domain-containing protein [Xanthomonadales bacterium]MCB1595898.1 DUF302 domain-containing protein [Xanthomonadales bacterium]HOP23633.1 DUF302 domain-containing protein [Gammaproteobacteria bacterium]HPI96517.1 DUF302 domain-containing protein [Gammaproteobacteria bacterium]